jgi:hypothetical protein
MAVSPVDGHLWVVSASIAMPLERKPEPLPGADLDLGAGSPVVHINRLPATSNVATIASIPVLFRWPAILTNCQGGNLRELRYA